MDLPGKSIEGLTKIVEKLTLKLTGGTAHLVGWQQTSQKVLSQFAVAQHQRSCEQNSG